MTSLLIKNGVVVDGTGNPEYKADIAVKDDKIISIDRKISESGFDNVLDASGKVVSPGFIDVHSHDDLYLISKPTGDEKIIQGVTTTITGNCGYSVAPFNKYSPEILEQFSGLLGGREILDKFKDTCSFESFLKIMENARPNINVLPLVGNVTLRIAAMGDAMRPPTEDELNNMKKLAEEAMQQGSFGFSSGLIYAPGSYASTDELVELSKVASAYNGMYISHIRGESETVLDAIEEAIEIGRRAELPVHISHLKIAGRDNWGLKDKLLKIIRSAREKGQMVTADQYPYTAGSTGLFALLPPDLLSNGIDELAVKLHNTEYRENLKKSLQDDANDGMLQEVPFEDVVISSSKLFAQYEGRSLAEIAKSNNQDPYDLLFDLLAEEKKGISMIMFSQSDEIIKQFMQEPYVMIGSDGLPLLNAKVHPRFTGTFPRILGNYVRKEKTLTLPDAIRKMTSLGAQTFLIHGKGLIKTGFDADFVIFDPDVIDSGSTYENPYGRPIGIDYVLVNGEIAVDHDEVKPTRSGRVIRRSSSGR